jgi:peptidase E
MAMQNRMSLINFNASNDLGVYTNLIYAEMMWLFKRKLPSQILFIPHAYDGNYYNSYIQSVIQVFGSFNVGVQLITDGKPPELIKGAAGIVAGGGSLEKLLQGVNSYKTYLIAALSNRRPYLGWNEGAVLPSPAYVVPAVLPVNPKCLGVTRYQFYAHYVDTDLNRFEIRNFLLNHKSDNPPVTQVICLPDEPGGSGMRLEDDVIGLDFAGGTPVDPSLKFSLNALDQLMIS